MTRKDIDWSAIKTDYTTGDMSIRDLADWNKVSEAAIRKRAKAEGWVRLDAAPKAPKKRRDLTVSLGLANQPDEAEPATDPKDIVARGHSLALRMLNELNATTTRQGELEAMICEATEEDEGDRRREAMMRAVSLGGRAATLRTLAQAAKTLAETASAAAAPAQGKKEQRQAAAEKVGGRFQVRQAPTLALVKS